MYSRRFHFVVMLLLASYAAGAQESGESAPEPAPALFVATPIVWVGESYQFGRIGHEIRIENRGDRDVRFGRVRPRARGGSGEVHPPVLPPGATAVARLAQEVGGALGRVRYAFAIETDDPAQPAPLLVLETFVQSAYDVEYPMLEFGMVDVAEGASLDFDVASREVPSVRLVEVVDRPPFLEVEETGRNGVAGEQVRLTFTIAPDAPLGHHLGGIRLRTDVPEQPDYVVGYQAAIYGDVVPSAAVIPIGAVRIGGSFDQSFRLTSRSGSPFRVERVEDRWQLLTAAPAPCAGASAPSPCWDIRLTGGGRREGQLDGTLDVWIAGSADPVPVAYRGLIASKDAQIHDLGVIGPEGVQRTFDPDKERP